MPASSGGFQYSKINNSSYSFHDIIVSGEELPEPFEHILQGTGHSYEYNVEDDSPDKTISYSAKANALSRTEKVQHSTIFLNPGSLVKGHQLSGEELALYKVDYKENYISGVVGGYGHSAGFVELIRLKSRDELEKEWQKTDPVGYSQHSSIVMSKDAPAKAMAFDLAIGKTKAFDHQYGEFWKKLLRTADWRMPVTDNAYALQQYKTGEYDYELVKKHMNRPSEILPKGEFGVVNEYYNKTTVHPAKYPEIHNEEIINLQWDMPKPASRSDVVLAKEETF